MNAFAGVTDLTDRLVNEQRRRILFLVGSALTAPARPGEPGVPGVDAVVQMIRMRHAGDARSSAELDEAIGRDGSRRYQLAFDWLGHRRGQDAVNDVVRAAVLCARRTPPAPAPETPEQFRSIEGDHGGWVLPPGAGALGELFATRASLADTILTTNFDPLVEVSLGRAGVPFYRTFLHSDGSLQQVEAKGCNVIHLHGDWLRSDTLHTPTQLGMPRPRLQKSLRALIPDSLLVAIAYGGWDDVLTTALSELMGDDKAFDIAWAFYESDPAVIDDRYRSLLTRLAEGHQRGRVRYYKGVDVNAFLPALRDHFQRSVAISAPAAGPSPVVVTGLSVERALRDLTSGDPLTSAPAAEFLLGRVDQLAAVVEQGTANLVGGAAVRRVLAARPAESAPLLLERLEPTRFRWERALTAAVSFAPAHAPYCSDALGTQLDRQNDPDVTRLTIEALGYAGSAGWAASIVDKLNLDRPFFEPDYYFQKYYGFVIGALARMVAQARVVDDARSVSHFLIQVLEVVFKHVRNGGTWGLSERLVFAQTGGGPQAEAYLREWLPRGNPRIRDIGVEALGDRRVMRAIPTLVALMSDPASASSTVKAASMALGDIGSPSAVAAILDQAPGAGRCGLCLCLDRVTDAEQFEESAAAALEARGLDRWCAARAIGLRPESPLGDRLTALLSSEDSLERAVAALALARRRAIGIPRLTRAREEASGALERAFVALAVVTLAPERYASVEAELRVDLAKDHSFMYWTPLRRDVLTVLSTAGVADAQRLADAWRPFYGNVED